MKRKAKFFNNVLITFLWLFLGILTSIAEVEDGVISQEGSHSGNENKLEAADNYIERGLSLDRQGKYNQAITNYTKAIEIKPDYARAYYDRGVAFGHQRKYTRAIVDYDQAIKLKPDYLNAYANRGIIYCRRKNYDRALADFNKALEINPNDADVLNSLGILYAETGDNIRALANYDKAIEHKLIHPLFYFNRGHIYYKNGDYDRAISDYSKAIELNPLYASEYYWRGKSNYQKGDYSQAIADFTRVIELQPKGSFPAALKICSAYLKAGDFSKALKSYMRFLPSLYYKLPITIILGVNLLLALFLTNPFKHNQYHPRYLLVILPFFLTGCIIILTIITAFTNSLWILLFRYGLLGLHVPLMFIILNRMKTYLWFATSINIFAIWCSWLMPWLITLGTIMYLS